MTGGLPPGLISIQDIGPTEEDNEYDTIDVDLVARTWKVYAASTRALHENQGNRMQNLFWRTWSNPYLRERLDPSTLTRIAQYFGSGGGQVPIRRPQPAPMAREHDATEDESTPVPSGASTTTTSPIQNSLAPITASHRPDHARNSSTSSAKSPKSPHSILKKPSVDQNYNAGLPDESRYRVSSDSHQEGIQSSSSNAPTLSPTSSDRPRIHRTTSGGGKKTSFLATSSGRSKTRPNISRRKSSQTTVSQFKEAQKSPLKSSAGVEPFPQIPENKNDGRKSIAPPPGLSDLKGANFLLPSASSWQSVDSGTDPQVTNGPEIQNSMPLVNPGFRKQFVEQQRSVSSINLAASASRMRKTGSVVRFADELPSEFGQNRTSTGNTSPEMKSGGFRRLSGSGLRTQSSAADTAAVMEDEDDEDDDLVMNIPRTKSQLSMLIDHRRKISGSMDVELPSQENNGKGERKGKADEDKEDTVDELLSMARRDGVTKAGGVSRSARAALRSSPGSDQRYRSPTPPPLYG